MTTPSSESEQTTSREDANWARPVESLTVSEVSSEAVNLNVEGRQVVGALQGFGRMWQKTYQVRLSGADVTPTEVIKTWKENFSDFWPEGNRLYAPLTGIVPGEVAVLNVSTGGMPLSTGVMVLYVDDESFTFMTPQGHVFAGWITFSAYESEGATVAQTQVLIRANDPIYEIGFRLGGSKAEDRFWQRTLTSLAGHFGVQADVQISALCVDPKVQWSEAKNVWHNAAIRTLLYTVLAPLRWGRDAVLRR